MDRFSGVSISDVQETKVVDHCDECGGEIYDGVLAWKVGSDIFCSSDCMLSNIGAKPITAGEE
ncbi:hypothetical protein POF51_22310 [Brevibacillus sp. AG]|uniref:hypothetical protein n=1 Tax=Brevibacillus sp. AG TaxID=3020891 RepID=UPI00232E68E8|nr:hypothetical protein [Brevibacillus sp. AG]MDC0763462.1 hypothetical protein [Brevibacillus sp. AG]